MKAYHHFSDPEWDGEPIPPEPKPEPAPRPVPPPEPPGPGPTPGPPRQRIKVKLADGKARTIQHMTVTSYWHPDGAPISAHQFLEMLFGKLPEFFKDEDELRALWSAPDTRAKLLRGLAEKGFGRDQLAEIQKMIDAENSDLFDVLAHVAYALPPLTREERAARAKVAIGAHFNTKQQAFLGFVLAQYVKAGVEELDSGKALPPGLHLRRLPKVSLPAVAVMPGGAGAFACQHPRRPSCMVWSLVWPPRRSLSRSRTISLKRFAPWSRPAPRRAFPPS